MFKHVLWVLGKALLVGTSGTDWQSVLPLSAQAGDKKADGPMMEILKVEGKLSADDPFDKKFPKSRHKEHLVKLLPRQKVRIDLKSQASDCYLRIRIKAARFWRKTTIMVSIRVTPTHASSSAPPRPGPIRSSSRVSAAMGLRPGPTS